MFTFLIWAYSLEVKLFESGDCNLEFKVNILSKCHYLFAIVLLFHKRCKHRYIGWYLNNIHYEFCVKRKIYVVTLHANLCTRMSRKCVLFVILWILFKKYCDFRLYSKWDLVLILQNGMNIWVDRWMLQFIYIKESWE